MDTLEATSRIEAARAAHLSWLDSRKSEYQAEHERRLAVLQKRQDIGARLFGSMSFGGGQYGLGMWSADRIEMVMHYRHWTFVAVRAICNAVAGLEPNIGHVRTRPDHEGHDLKWLRNVKRWEKSFHAIKPHEEIEVVGPDHPLSRLLASPNAQDTAFDLWTELVLFLLLTGNSYVWAIPSKFGRLSGTGSVSELWVIPAHWVVRVEYGRDRLIENYVLQPFWGGGGNIRLPADEVIHFRFKSPVHKVDGYSAQTAIAEWTDSEESVGRARFFQMKNGCFQVGALELGESYHDPDDVQLDRIAAKFYARYQGEHRTGIPMILPPDMKYNPLTIAPDEMSYIESENQLRDMVLAGFGVPKEIAMIQDAGSEIAMYGPMRQFANGTLAPLLRQIGQQITMRLASRWDADLRVWWDDPTPDNPDQVNKDVETDLHCILPGQELQGQVIGGSKAWYSGKAVKIVMRSGGILFVTPRHPVMTMKGLVSAGQLKKGQSLLCHFRSQPGTTKNDVKNTPSLVEDVFDSLLRCPSFASGKVTASDVEFHGDAKWFQGDIQVVGSYCKLRRALVSEHQQNVDKFGFVRLGFVKRLLRTLGEFMQNFWANLSTFVSGCKFRDDFGRKLFAAKRRRNLPTCNLPSLCDAETFPPPLTDRLWFAATRSGRLHSFSNFRSIHAKVGCFSGASDWDAADFEFLPQPHVSNPNPSGDLFDGHARLVQPRHFNHVGRRLGYKPLCFGSAPELDAALAEFNSDSVNATALLSADGSDGFSGQITLDEIIDVGEIHYDGPVYDFESTSGLIVVNGIVISNCNAISPNEVRAIRGREPWERGGNNPMGPMGVVEIPLQEDDGLGIDMLSMKPSSGGLDSLFGEEEGPSSDKPSDLVPGKPELSAKLAAIIDESESVTECIEKAAELIGFDLGRPTAKQIADWRAGRVDNFFRPVERNGKSNGALT